MKVNLRKILAAGVMMYSMAVTAQTVEVDGVYYELSGSTATAVKPQSGEYTGAFTLVPQITLDNVVYSVRLSSNSLQGSEISEFTLADGWQNARLNTPIYLRDVEKLERINLMCGIQAAESDYYSSTISLDGRGACVDLIVNKGIDRSSIRLSKFNVYGPDGNRLTPFLLTEESEPERITPDADGTFKLGKDFFTTDGRHCGVTELSTGYLAVMMYMEINGYVVGLRLSPLVGQGSDFYTVGGFNYVVWGGRAMLSSQNPATTSGDIVIPEKVVINDTDMAVELISEEAFKGCLVTSVTFPSSLTATYGTVGLDNCETLTSVDLSAVSVPGLRLSFDNCPKLVEVKFPENLSQLNYTFADCTSLENVVLPSNLEVLGARAFKGCKSLSSIELPSTLRNIGMSAFEDCSLSNVDIPAGCLVSCAFTINNPDNKLYDIEVLECLEQAVRLKLNWSNITGGHGAPLPLCVVPDKSPVSMIMYPDENDVFIIPRYDSNNRLISSVYFSYNSSAGDYMPGLQVGDTLPQNRSLFKYTLPQYSGVEEIEATGNDCPAEFFDLQGRPVNCENAAPGIYIRRQGSTSSKVVIR